MQSAGQDFLLPQIVPLGLLLNWLEDIIRLIVALDLKNVGNNDLKGKIIS